MTSETATDSQGGGGAHLLHLKVLVDGKAKPVNASPDSTVLEVIKKALGPQREDQADQYELVPEGKSPLEPGLTLSAAGIIDRELLSLNKKDGGGGAR
jgi:hypothetical protein